MSGLPFSIPSTTPSDQLTSLAGRTAIVTGGSRGLGEAVVRRFVDAGADVVFTGRHAEALAAVEASLAGLPGTGVGMVADVSSLADSRRLVDATQERFGRLDILVNNAAVFPPGAAMQVDERTWDRVLDTDTKGAFFLAQFAAEAMAAGGRGGRIINFLSTAFVNATPVFAAYAIAKGGLWEATRVMSQELAPQRITVNAVTPGATMTQERIDAFASGDVSAIAGGALPAGFEEFAAQMLEGGRFAALLQQMVPMGRPGFPDDLAKAVLFLASDMAEYVTGQNIVVDGGQSAAAKVGPMGASTLQQAAQTAPTPDGGAGHADADAPHVVRDAAAKASAGDADPGLTGTYRASVNTPMGRQEIELVLATEGKTLSGSMVFMGRRIPFENGTATTAGFSYALKIKVALRSVEGAVSGVRDGDTVTGTVTSPMGAFPFEGTRSA